ncbi:ribonuclease-3 [Caldicoprobacter guelmensis]|uniref:ribonuclease III n=1 Tax=Caldicoprobacter guelmensis TaxID=1170224 RepID=UPI00195966A3|nr:ribonuclease III [Caldicoprobacter guelmensis]MBM7581229.1 ribonuclease-3 [Caldicoprobacter guelmensis]
MLPRDRECQLKEFESNLEYEFDNIQLLDVALTHSSYANERGGGLQHNERLEFLGDSVLGLVISEYLYTNFPELTEGSLTKIKALVVSEACLAKAARRIGLGQRMLLGKGEERTGGRDRDSILADAFESVIAAIFLDGGLEQARKFVLKNLAGFIDDALTGKGIRDYKTDLQEVLQRESDKAIEYRIVRDSGPDHQKIFIAQVYHGDKLLGEGVGRSKKEAEQHAAQKALEDMGK